MADERKTPAGPTGRLPTPGQGAGSTGKLPTPGQGAGSTGKLPTPGQGAGPTGKLPTPGQGARPASTPAAGAPPPSSPTQDTSPEAVAELVKSLREEEPIGGRRATPSTPAIGRRVTPRRMRRLSREAPRTPSGSGGAIEPLPTELVVPFRVRMPLAAKYILLISALVIIVCLLFGMVAVSILKDKLEDEIVRYGRNQVLALRALGEKIYADFTAPAIGNGDTSGYQQSQEGELALAQLQRLAEADPRILDLTIFAWPTPTTDPSGVVLSTRQALSYSRPREVEADAEGVLSWRGWYESAQGREQVLFFRAPISGSGDALLATANLILSMRGVEEEGASVRNRIIIFGFIFVGIGIGLSLFLASAVTRPVEALVRDMDVVSRGDLDHETAAQTRDEIGLLAATFNRMTQDLREAHEREREVSRLNSELDLAKEIHAKVFPDKLPNLPGLDIFTTYSCAKEVGGDYYDFFGVSVEQGLLGMVVADVSGKGIPGSMVMGTTRTILRMMAYDNPNPADVLSKTNYHVARDIRRGMFVTMVYAILDVRGHRMAVASAGHNPLLLWRAATRTHELVRPSGIALGFDKGPIFDRTVQEVRLQLSRGDRALLYTDGVVEAMNEQHEEWGEERLHRFVDQHAELPSRDFVRLLMQTLQQHQGAAEQHDDITVVTFRIVG